MFKGTGRATGATGEEPIIRRDGPTNEVWLHRWCRVCKKITQHTKLYGRAASCDEHARPQHTLNTVRIMKHCEICHRRTVHKCGLRPKADKCIEHGDKATQPTLF